jgi:hypothetical protein
MFMQADAHTDIRIIFISAWVTILGLSHMTYCSETRDTKYRAVRERVKVTVCFDMFMHLMGQGHLKEVCHSDSLV